MPPPPRHPGALLACLAPALLAACAKDERLVNYKPFFAGLEGAEHATAPVVSPTGDAGRLAAAEGDLAAAQGFNPALMQIEHDDGTVTLVSKAGVHLMRHIERCLAEDDEVLFAEQVLSQMSRQEFVDRGRDPAEALGMLKPRQRDIMKLFSRLPMGEYSPNARLEVVGRNIWRVRLSEAEAAQLGSRYRGFDMVLEDGSWRLRWFF